MKKIGLILFIGILIASCNQNKKQNPNQRESESTKINQVAENFDWLLGQWKRLDEEKGKETFENWDKISKTEYSGIGFTMQNGDIIKQEKIRLIKLNGKWNLIVLAPEDTKSIVFMMTNFSESEFTCENNEIDFPNTIRYWKNGTKLHASVSNSEMEIPFEFEKLLK